ncbi:MAG: hypothetical protein M1835_007182 [Candelina submexicana]|nr:MAG: hypothetical protein M1835_007182 [Candelina submexicana]
MNGSRIEAGNQRNLKGFYAYKDTFDKGSVWVDIPKQVTFVDNSDPCGQLSSPESDALPTSRASSVPERFDDSQSHLQPEAPPSSVAPLHGLQALSAAASGDYYCFPLPIVSPVPSMLRHPDFDTGDSAEARPQPDSIPSSVAPSTSSSNNINFILNPSPAAELSPINPSLLPRFEHPASSYAHSSPPLRHDSWKKSVEASVDDHEIAFLLRHFSEAPGQWLEDSSVSLPKVANSKRMDLFDLGTYFASHVPIRALSYPLLKYAACAYAAKQLGQVKGEKAIIGGICSEQANMEQFSDATKVDWNYKGAKYYEKAILLLMEALQGERDCFQFNCLDSPGLGPSTETIEEDTSDRSKRRRLSSERFSSTSSDELLAATAILCVYEFLDASSAAWSRHLNGAKSLLDIAEVGILPLQSLSTTSSLHSHRSRLSRARKATFWNFARQDFLNAFINECQTRLDTEDLFSWKAAGLLLDERGFIRPSNTDDSGFSESHDVMREDMISNALIWLMSKLINYLAAGDGIYSASSRLHDGLRTEEDSSLGINQQTLLMRWEEIRTEIEVWFDGLPDTFKPCARVRYPVQPSSIGETRSGTGFYEIWYSIPMCASTMQSYHMARILLLINKPQESTARRSTVARRLQSYRVIESEILYHSREICGIALSRAEASVRIHSLQPLFVAGQCLTEPHERKIILDLLRSIETDLGWATEYRVKQLLAEWCWDRVQ